MSIVTLLLVVWIIGMAARWITGKQEQRRTQKSMERLRADQRRLREEQREQARKQTEHAIALERARQEREELRREQERQADEIAKLRHTIEQAQFDIDFLNERVGRIDIQTDYYITLQSATTPGGAEWWKYQKKIDVLKNQAHTVEKQINRAKFQKEQAQRKLA